MATSESPWEEIQMLPFQCAESYFSRRIINVQYIECITSSTLVFSYFDRHTVEMKAHVGDFEHSLEI